MPNRHAGNLQSYPLRLRQHPLRKLFRLGALVEKYRNQVLAKHGQDYCDKEMREEVAILCIRHMEIVCKYGFGLPEKTTIEEYVNAS